ncbi:MAG: dNTP triphosphohydrolase [Phycisphaerae bacterium]|nr:dNTP triphosphohydrolase [Phycisphaerae bacterium]
MKSYAVSELNSRGRAFLEKAHPYRTAFERDRDRIIHSSAFRRLEGKTQVFTPGLDDYYRTRLTHTIEVSQIGRTIARALDVNESLTEAICLAHDLGHAPFGHTGEHVLNDLLEGCGGYEHNRQSLRIVTELEHPYPEFMGLNLMYETRLALAKHRSPYDHPEHGGGFLEPQCTLEGQIADLADRIAYNCHDLEDGQKARLIQPDQLVTLEIVSCAQAEVHAETLDDWTIKRTRTAKAMLNRLVNDCIETSRQRLAQAGVAVLEDVTQQGDTLIRISDDADQQLRTLERFLMDHFYLHPTLQKTADQVRQWLTTLFESLCHEPTRMPRYFQSFIESRGLKRAVADYMAGMTDRYCLKLLGH